MKLAVIDMGTNTFNVLVAEQIGNTFKVLYDHKIAVKLGEGGINNKRIEKAPFKRGVDASGKLLQLIKPFKPDNTIAVATSAIRSAVNGKDFVNEVRKKFKLDIQVISGAREATFIYLGVSKALKLKKQPSLIMDIGGGSTEFILANENGIIWKKSYALGVARLLEKFKPDEPISEACYKCVKDFLEIKLHDLFEMTELYKPEELIGSSGSFDTFAELLLVPSGKVNHLQNVNSYNFPIGKLKKVLTQLKKSNRQQRLEMPGMLAMRVDMIVLAAVFTEIVLEKCNLNKLRLSTYALKEGVIEYYLNKKK